MESLTKIYNICNELNNQGISSYDQLRQFKNNGGLDNVLNTNGIYDLLKNDFQYFFDVLFSYNYPHYLKTLALEGLLTRYRLGGTEFVLCLYCDSEEAYRNLPLLLYKLIDKLNISKYSFLSVNDIKGYLYSIFNIDDKFNSNLGKQVFEIVPKIYNSKYDQYKEVCDGNFSKINISDPNWFYIWGEYDTYALQKSSLKDYKYPVIWVSKDYGDGYGYDVLSFDEKNDQEKLIEVKTGKKNEFDLTENENKVMRNAHLNNAIYMIHKYTYDKISNTINSKYFIYSPEIERLLNPEGEIFTLTRYTNMDNKVMYGVIRDLNYKPKVKSLV